MFCSGLHPVLSCWELSGCISLSCYSPLYFSIQVFCGFICFFQVKFPVSTSQLLPKPHVQHSRTPDPLSVQGALDTGCRWDAAGHGPGTAFGDCSPQEGLPDRRTSMPFGAECFSRCLWVKRSLRSALAPLCHGLSSINNQLLFPCCWNFLS